jgi:hypothetical protein
MFRKAINIISVDPANSQRLYLISSNGVFRSTDGGQNRTFRVDSNGEARSLVLDTSSPAGARIFSVGA